MRRTVWAWLCAIGLCCALGSTARAANEISVRVSADFGADGGLYATGASKTLLQGEFNYAHTVWSFRRGELWVEGSWTIGERQDQVLGGFDTRLIAQQLTGGVRATFPIRAWLVPTVRGGLGALIGSLHLHGFESGDVTQTSAALTTYALAGVQFLLPRPWKARNRLMSLGVVIEGGYTWSMDLRYSLAPPPSGDMVQTKAVPTDLGALSLSGGLLRVGLALRF